jgi:hypothetical protein
MLSTSPYVLESIGLPARALLFGLLTEALLFGIVLTFGKWSPCNPENWISGIWLMLHIPAFYIGQWLHLQFQFRFVDSTMLINVVLWTVFWFCIFKVSKILSVKYSAISERQPRSKDSADDGHSGS